MGKVPVTNKKRLIAAFAIFCVLLVALCVRDGYIRRSLTAYKGLLTHEETSAIQNRQWIRPEDVLGIKDRRLDPAPPATTTRSENYIVLK